jgi:hypothetical protein
MDVIFAYKLCTYYDFSNVAQGKLGDTHVSKMSQQCPHNDTIVHIKHMFSWWSYLVHHLEVSKGAR